MSEPDPLGRQGSIVWAIAPFEVATPLAVVQHDGSERRYDSGRELASAVRRRIEPPEFDLRVPAKIRPVVLLQDRPTARFRDYAALRLGRLEKLTADEQAAIREDRARGAIYLGHDRERYGLDKEYAIDLTSLHRVHSSAIVSAPSGRIDRSQLRRTCERLVEVSDLDLSSLILRRASELLVRLEDRR